MVVNKTTDIKRKMFKVFNKWSIGMERRMCAGYRNVKLKLKLQLQARDDNFARAESTSTSSWRT